jgi:hypothetical protein
MISISYIGKISRLKIDGRTYITINAPRKPHEADLSARQPALAFVNWIRLRVLRQTMKPRSHS